MAAMSKPALSRTDFVPPRRKKESMGKRAGWPNDSGLIFIRTVTFSLDLDSPLAPTSRAVKLPEGRKLPG